MSELYRITIELFVLLGTTSITWIFARRKTDEEVRGMQLENGAAAIEIYKKLADDLKKDHNEYRIALEEMSEKIESLELKIDLLQKENRTLKNKLKNQK